MRITRMMFCTDSWVYYAFAETSITLLNVGSFLTAHEEFLGITFVFSAGRLVMSELSGSLRSRGVASPTSSHDILSIPSDFHGITCVNFHNPDSPASITDIMISMKSYKSCVLMFPETRDCFCCSFPCVVTGINHHVARLKTGPSALPKQVLYRL